MKTLPLVLFAIAFAAAVQAAGPAQAPANSDAIPCRVVKKTQAIYPPRMLEQGITHGEAKVVLEIDPTGHISDQLVTAYSHPEFGREAERVVKEWTFLPGRSNGEPVVCVVSVTFNFTVNGTVAYERFYDTIRSEDYAANAFAYAAHGPGTLDRKPAAVVRTQPIYPKAWIEEGRRGTVTLRFFIDETGRPRVPTIAAGTDELLATAAVVAVKEWKFQPPTVRGKPVLAYAEQTFTFEPPTQVANK